MSLNVHKTLPTLIENEINITDYDRNYKRFENFDALSNSNYRIKSTTSAKSSNFDDDYDYTTYRNLTEYTDSYDNFSKLNYKLDSDLNDDFDDITALHALNTEMRRSAISRADSSDLKKIVKSSSSNEYDDRTSLKSGTLHRNDTDSVNTTPIDTPQKNAVGFGTGKNEQNNEIESNKENLLNKAKNYYHRPKRTPFLKSDRKESGDTAISITNFDDQADFINNRKLDELSPDIRSSASNKYEPVTPQMPVTPRLVVRQQGPESSRVRTVLNELPLRTVSRNNTMSNVLSSYHKAPISVDTSKANSNLEVVRLCLNELGWQEFPEGSPNGCDIYWHSSTCHEGYHSSKLAYNHSGRVNKFPCMNQLLRKGPLTLVLNVLRSVYTDQYDFYPRTWFLPEQFDDFKTECTYMHERQTKLNKPLTTFIVKPNDASQGEGIHLIKNPNDFLQLQASSARNRSRAYIVQEYIDNPFLIDGLKSDLRIYVLVTSLKPLEIYICDEGLVRFATVNYERPDDNNLKQIYMHLTNYSLNKKNDSYVFTKDVKQNEATEQDTNKENMKNNNSSGEGSKRKLSKVFAYMESEGHNVNKIKTAIDDLVIKTIFALLPEMKIEFSFEIPPNSSSGPSCFQIFGFDILLTKDLKPMLLEVNCNPSLRIDYETHDENGKTICLPSPIDYEIKKPLVLETLKLIAPQMKLNFIERCKLQEIEQAKSARIRDSLAKERVKERSKLLQRAISANRTNFTKYPLLSKPASDFIEKSRMQFISQLTSSAESFHTFSNPNSAPPQSYINDSSTELSPSQNATFLKYMSLLNQPNGNTTMNGGYKPCLRKLFPLNRTKSQFSYLNILENVADIFTYMTLNRNAKVMNQAAFRSLINKCYLINEKVSSDNLDIIYSDARKKWCKYNRRKDLAGGLCFQGFVELFIILAKMNFPNDDTETSLRSLIFHCIYFLKLDGFQGNDSCVISRNGPVTTASDTVLSTIEHINEMKRLEAKLNANYQYIGVFTANKPDSSKQQLAVRQLGNIGNTKIKTKRSLFPIYFEGI